MGHGFRQRDGLGLGQRLPAGGIKAARIFAVRPQEQGKEFRRQFIMLAVGGIGVFGDRLRRHGAGKGLLGARRRDAGIIGGDNPAHPGTDDEIRQRCAFGKTGGSGGE